MRIAILTSHPIQYQTPLFRTLSQRHVLECTVFFCWDFGIQETHDGQFGASVQWDIPLLNGFNSVFLKNYSLKASSTFWGQVNPGIISALVKGHYDALLLYGWNSFSNILAALTALALRIPIILHGESTAQNEHTILGSKRFIKRILLGYLFSRVKAFLVIGKQNEAFYRLYGIDEKLFFPCPYTVDTERFIRAAQVLLLQRGALRKKYGISEDAIVILTVVKLIEKKRPLDLLTAYHRIQTDKTFLLYVGEGSLRKDIEEICAHEGINEVCITGFINQSILPEYYCLADIFVLCSDSGETWGLVVNEAMSCGLPVIVSDKAGCAEDLVRHGVNGYSYSCGDIPALANHLRNLSENKESRMSFGKKSLERMEFFTHDKDCAGILDAVRYVTSKS